MAYLEDYPHLYALSQQYPLCNAPVADFKRAMLLDGYPESLINSASYDHKGSPPPPPLDIRHLYNITHPVVGRKTPVKNERKTPKGKLSLFSKLGIK